MQGSGAAREFGIRYRSAAPWAGKAATAELVRVVVTALAIVAGPVLASLVESPLPSHERYNSGLHLRGSLAFDSEFKLRGSIR